jgi:hypothetical protein
VNDQPRRLFEFLEALRALSREHGVVIVSGDLEFKDAPHGRYCLNPNDGPEFGWRDDGDFRGDSSGATGTMRGK